MKSKRFLGETAVRLFFAGFVVWAAATTAPGNACDEKIFDDGTIANAFYFPDSLTIMARSFEGSFSPVGMEWGEINTISLAQVY